MSDIRFLYPEFGLFFFSVSNHFFFGDNFVAVNQIAAFCEALLFPKGVSGFVVAKNNKSGFCNSLLFQRVNRAGKKLRRNSASSEFRQNCGVVNVAAPSVVSCDDCSCGRDWKGRGAVPERSAGMECG